MRNKQYFQLNTAGNVANLYIFGDVTSFPTQESDVSAYNLSRQIDELGDVAQINVNINSYGGEVTEGLAIYHALKRHKARVTTVCDGSACSIASVIFMAGDERIMCKPSFLMIHDAWTICGGNANQLRKQADDLDVITSASIDIYMQHVNISENELRDLMKAESWLKHTDALEMGFATAIEESSANDKPSQSVRNRVFEMLETAFNRHKMQADEDSDDEEEEDDVKAPETPSDAPNTEDEEEPADDDKDGESGDSGDDDAPDEDDNKKNDEKDGADNKKYDEPDPAQRWSGFFNALFRV